ncbi:ribonuclease domain-containing protein [Streptomyces sp. NPDC050560]|uniref:ribonuclease domain-containing protein n=1 Tax=Streptomyces sp. NPDC050560 TaxID=3365630 RepID=UPI0037BD8E03
MRIPTRILSVSAVSAALLFGGSAAAIAAPTPHTATTAVTAHARVLAVGDICYSDLPSQAHDTLDLIDQGGPYPYPQDDGVFENREGLLPQQSNGYYHEYTVETPGSPDRGARRIIAGQATDEDYYTADHYESFDLVDFDC